MESCAFSAGRLEWRTHRKPPDNHAIFFSGPLGQLVFPCVMVDRAGGYHLDVVTTGRKPERSLTA